MLGKFAFFSVLAVAARGADPGVRVDDTCVEQQTVDEVQALLQTRSSRTADDIMADLTSGRYILDKSLGQKGTIIGPRFVVFEGTHYSREGAIELSLGSVVRCEGLCLVDAIHPLVLQTGFGLAKPLFEAQGGHNIAVSQVIFLDSDSMKEFNNHVDLSAIPKISANLFEGAARVRDLAKSMVGGDISDEVNISGYSKDQVGFQEVHFEQFAAPSFADAIKKEYSDIEPDRIRVVTSVLIAVTPFIDVGSTCQQGSIGGSVTEGKITVGGDNCQGSTWSMPQGGLIAYRVAYINGDGELEQSGDS